jgi:anti-sigma regulatory factor (Ser/Thr protein kinase)
LWLLQMLELALHILDIAENSVRASAKTVLIEITEDSGKDLLSFVIRDDGKGMSKAVLKKVMDPFYTSKKVRRVGLGLPMLSEAAGRAGGRLAIESQEGMGTRIAAEFQFSHIDRQPLGDITGALTILIAGNAGVDFVFRYQCADRLFRFDTKEIRQQIGDIPIQQAEVLKWIRQYIREGLIEIGINA